LCPLLGLIHKTKKIFTYTSFAKKRQAPVISDSWPSSIWENFSMSLGERVSDGWEHHVGDLQLLSLATQECGV
jgi:hypothetical protein